ncbi:hypothetical protein CIB48_g6041 [Xylaria polymorpha]|nr:hypothetical protein CIB48_g6041 [Xylaria polymorpha]
MPRIDPSDRSPPPDPDSPSGGPLLGRGSGVLPGVFPDPSVELLALKVCRVDRPALDERQTIAYVPAAHDR